MKKRIVGIILAIVLVFSFGSVAFAATPTGTVVTGVTPTLPSGQQLYITATHAQGTAQWTAASELIDKATDLRGMELIALAELAVFDSHMEDYVPNNLLVEVEYGFSLAAPLGITVSGDMPVYMNSNMTGGWEKVGTVDSVKTQMGFGLFAIYGTPSTTPDPAPGTDPMQSTVKLPAGTKYYTMVEGAPGDSHELSTDTYVEVIEKLSNGYTKIMIGTTTYLIKTNGESTSGENEEPAEPLKVVNIGSNKLETSLSVHPVNSSGDPMTKITVILPANSWIDYIDNVHNGVRIMNGGSTFMTTYEKLASAVY